jgi:phospholipid/cholesterol/gamma-HCH transport system permease protein
VVRAVADRSFLPVKGLFEQVGNMVILTGKTLVATVKPPYPYGGEFIGQFLFALQLCWFPMMISTIAFGFGAPGLQAANFLTLFGALDRLGGFFILASVREFAPFVTAVVVAGVAGTAITADLGARKIREELDDHGAHGHLRAALRDLRRDLRRARLRPAPGRLLCDPLYERLDHRPVGLAA